MAQTVESPRRRRPSILIVEDSRSDIFLIREAMAEAGIDANLQVIQDGNQATQFFDQADVDENIPCPDLVLLDLNLPKRSGNEVLQHMRQSKTCRNAKVLIVTSSDSLRERQAVDALGCNGYFRKPSEYKEFLKLGDLVKQHLEQRTE
jgi:chemotaxis family two-component system response regulator Rcp1